MENRNASGGRSKATCGLKFAAPVADDRQRRHHRADPEADSEAADGVDAAIEQRDVDGADNRRHHERALTGQAGEDVARVVGEADVPRRNFERSAQDELPDEEKRHQLTGASPEPIAQVPIRAARPRHHRAKLAPHQAVGDDDNQRREPADQRLRAAQGRHQERDRDERPDADHVRHVQRRGLKQAETALERRGRGGIRHRRAILSQQVD